MRGQTAVFALTLLVVAGTAHRAAMPAAAQLAPRDQREGDITYLDGRDEYLMAWSEDRGAGSRIYARRVRVNGTAVGGPTQGEWEATREGPQGSTGGRGEQRWPSIIPGLLVYSEQRPGSTDFDIYGQPLFDNGRPSGLPMLVAGGTGNQMYPSVVAAARGRGQEYFIVWSEDTRDVGDVMGIRVDFALRRSRGPAFPVAQGPGTSEDPTIQPDPLGSGFLVLYTDDRSGTKDIYATRLVESGLPRGGARGGQFPVIATGDDDYAPALATGTDRSGRRENTARLLLWTRDDLTRGPEVMGLRLSATGLPIGRAFTVAGGPGLQGWPATATRLGDPDARGRDASDEFLVTWSADPVGNLDILGLRVGLLGAIRTRASVLAGD